MEHYKNLSLEDIEGEVWRDIHGYEGLYKVSDLGRIKSLEKQKGKFFKNSTIMKLSLDKDGYCKVGLSKESKCVSKTVHRLVAFEFIPNPENKKFVNHKKGIKIDNRAIELEWVTQSENEKHAHKIGLKKVSLTGIGRLGVLHKKSKSVNQYDLNGVFIKNWESMNTILLNNNKISTSLISRCCKNENKTAYGFKWKYKNK